MDKIRSKDGTAIAFDRVGEGLPIILVVGAFNDRATGAPLAAALKDRFSVITYDLVLCTLSPRERSGRKPCGSRPIWLPR
jgi:hypothetical protein